jgi:MOSC domain-containing protein YiiM
MPGQLGENITTTAIDLLSLPRGARLRIGNTAELEITGLRNPCAQINGLSAGLLKQLVFTHDHGEVIRLAGVMSIVLRGGEIRSGDSIRIALPGPPHEPLTPV